MGHVRRRQHLRKSTNTLVTFWVTHVFICPSFLISCRSLFFHTAGYWNHSPACTRQTVTIKDIYAVFERFGDLLVFINGKEETDELICMQQQQN